MKFKGFTLTLLSFGLAVLSGMKPAAAATLQVIASGLDNPRGIAFAPDGTLYFTEAGRGGPGPVIEGPELGVLLAFGTTGRITRIQNGIQERVVTGLPSLSLSPEGTTLPSEGGSREPAIGPQDIGFDRNGNAYVVIGYANPEIRDNLGTAGFDLGRLIAFTVDENGGLERRTDFSVDLSTYERLNNPDGEDLVSNPYALAVQEDNNVLVVDAGGNDLFRVDSTGNFSLEALFSSRPIDGILSQSAPTSIAIGPDGAYYIGELTGFPYPEGEARIYRVVPGSEPEIYTESFTQISGLDFDAAGNLYVLEYSVNSLASSTNLVGAITKVSPDGTRTPIVSAGEGLFAPTGVTVGPDGALYVSNYGSIAGEGQIVRIDPTASVPEPTSALAVLAVGILGLGSLQRCNRTRLT